MTGIGTLRFAFVVKRAAALMVAFLLLVCAVPTSAWGQQKDGLSGGGAPNIEIPAETRVRWVPATFGKARPATESIAASGTRSKTSVDETANDSLRPQPLIVVVFVLAIALALKIPLRHKDPGVSGQRKPSYDDIVPSKSRRYRL